MKYFVSFVSRKNGEKEKFANCELETAGSITYQMIQDFQTKKRENYKVDEIRVLFFQKLE